MQTAGRMRSDRAVAVYGGALAACLLLFAALTVAVTHGDLIPDWDAHLNRWLEDNASHSLTRGFELITNAGSFWGLLVVCVIAAGLLVRERAWVDLTLLVAALAGAAILNPLAKQAIARPRPAYHDPHLVLTTYSYPSGHAMGTTAVYGALAFIAARRLRAGPRATVAVVAAAGIVVLIATSRVYLGAHYLSDVVGGVLLGSAWLLVCVLALTVRERRAAGSLEP